MPHRAICFVIMPFGRKPDASGREIDFDAVYANIVSPAIEDVGLEPVRADEEMNAGLIHKAMYERLALSEYAIADLTIFNPNVYYELGVRHALRPQTTVLISAEASRLPFDVGHLRALPYAMDGEGKLVNAAAARERLKNQLIYCKSHDEPDSPLFRLLEGLKPPEVDHEKTDIFRRDVVYSRELKNRLRKARGKSAAELDAVRADFSDIGGMEAGVVIDLYLSYRAVRAWRRMVELYHEMDPVLRHTALVQEQYAFALNRLGEHDEAEAVLTEVIVDRGPSSETLGLLGRVYKDRWQSAVTAGDPAAAGWAQKAVSAYIKGFEADWRDAYPGVNALTLMSLTAPDDPRIKAIAPVVRYAVDRKIARGAGDYWDYASLVELGVIANDFDAAEKALPLALASMREPWEGETTSRNLALISKARSEEDVAFSARLDRMIATLSHGKPSPRSFY